MQMSTQNHVQQKVLVVLEDKIGMYFFNIDRTPNLLYNEFVKSC